MLGRTKGTRLWVVDDHSAISGWVESADVRTPADAIAERSEAIRRAPTPRDLEARAIGRVALGEMDAALADYDGVIRSDPDRPIAYNNLTSLRPTCPDATHRDAAPPSPMHGGRAS